MIFLYRQSSPTACLTGNVAGGDEAVLSLWQAEPESGSSLPQQHTIMAGQGVPEKGD